MFTALTRAVAVFTGQAACQSKPTGRGNSGSEGGAAFLKKEEEEEELLQGMLDAERPKLPTCGILRKELFH